MVKTILSIILAGIIIVSSAIYESDFIKRQFCEFDETIEVLYEKVENHTAVEDDVYALQSNWVDKKRVLHIFIPHNEIKEFDLWIAEAVKLVKNEKWDDALSKIEVIKELSEQIPKTFSISLENIF